MTFNKLGYVSYNPINSKNFSEELEEKITSILGDSYYDNISIHTDNCEEPEVWLEFSAQDINYKKLIGKLLTQAEYNALAENNADYILFY